MKTIIKIVISIGIICLIPLLFWTGMRIYACKEFYASVSNTEQGYGHALPKKFAASKNIIGEKFNLGYGSFNLPAKKINKILLVKSGWCVLLNCNNFELRLFQPRKHNSKIFNQCFPDKSIFNSHGTMVKRLKELMKQPDSENIMPNLFSDYRWKKLALSSKHKSFIDILFSVSR